MILHDFACFCVICMKLGPSENIDSYCVCSTLEGQSTYFGAIWEAQGGPWGAQGRSREVQGESKGVPRAQKGDKMEPQGAKSLPRESKKVTKRSLGVLKIDLFNSGAENYSKSESKQSKEYKKLLPQ